MTKKLVSFDDQAEPGQGLPAAVKAELNNTYAQGQLGGAKVADVAIGTATGVRAIARFGGYVWGWRSARFHRSTDGDTWQDYAPTPPEGSAMKLLPCADGEVLAVTPSKLYRSTGWGSGTPTWEVKTTVEPGAGYALFNVDGNGTKFIAGQYSSGSNFIGSRYAHISLDMGKTWTLVWDSVARFGETLANASHIHGCCYDPWSDRFYIAEGHGAEIAGIYTSIDNCATWTRHPGMVQNPPPTVIIATDDGLCCGSDASVGGLHGVQRHSDPAQEVIRPVRPWATGANGSATFATGGFRDPDTGLVWVGFYVGAAGVRPSIMVGTATQGEMAWQWPNTATASGDHITEVFPVKGRLLATALIGGQVSLLRGRTVGPVAPSLVDLGNVIGGDALDGQALAAGALSQATKSGNSAVGVRAEATGTLSDALGYMAKASGDTSMAVGRQAEATGQGAMAVGYLTKSLADGSTVVGHQSTSTESYTVVVGRSASAAGSGAVAIGFNAKVKAGQGLAVGNSSLVDTGAPGSMVFGTSATSTFPNTVVFGGAATTGNQVQFGARHLEFATQGDPSPPAAGCGRMFFRTVEGKVQLAVRFPTGAVQTLAVEP